MGPSGLPQSAGKSNKTSREEREGQERRGRRQQAASSHLLPARGGSRAPPALRLMGRRLALGGGGDTHDTARSHPPPERSRVGGFRRGLLALPPRGSWAAWVPSPQLSSLGGSGDHWVHGGNIGVSPLLPPKPPGQMCPLLARGRGGCSDCLRTRARTRASSWASWEGKAPGSVALALHWRCS